MCEDSFLNIMSVLCELCVTFPPVPEEASVPGGVPGDQKAQKVVTKYVYTKIFCAESFLPVRLQVSVIEFVRYPAMFLRTIDGGSYSRFMRKTRSI